MGQTFISRAIGWTEPGFDGIYGVENTSNGPIFVRKVQLRPVGGCTSTFVNGTGTSPGKFRLVRISGYSGEVAQTITPAPCSTASSALPAQVTLVCRPDIVTEVSTYRSIVPIDGTMNGLTGYGRTARRPGSGIGLNASDVSSERYDSSAQPLVLAAGEGIAFLKTESDLPAARRFSLVFTVVATGASWVADFVSTSRGAPNGVAWALMNGASSGVALEVRVIEHHDNNEGCNSNVTAVQSFPCIRLARGEGCLGGTDLTPLSPVSNQAPAGVRFVRGPFSHVYAGTKAGAQIDVYSKPGAVVPLDAQMRLGILRRCMSSGLGIEVDGIRTMLNPPGWEDLYTVDGSREGLQINPGESVAVLGGRQSQTNLSSFDTYDVTVLITVPDTRSGAKNFQRSLA